MIVRVTGLLESINGNRAVIALGADGAQAGGGMAREVLIPTYLAARLLASSLGAKVTLHTLEYLEGQGQGTSFVPRMIGFASPEEREFFELLTTVKGLGNKRALRALAEEPALISQAIMHEDVKWLQRLPEIGKRLAETVVVDLREKIKPLAADLGAVEFKPGIVDRGVLGGPGGVRAHSPAASDAVEALVALGETPADAERLVSRALERNKDLKTTEEILGAALGAGRT
jgi:Holliday junction DNA helicase RuvA